VTQIESVARGPERWTLYIVGLQMAYSRRASHQMRAFEEPFFETIGLPYRCDLASPRFYERFRDSRRQPMELISRSG